eukprot:7194533-Pyramimonas_sp.AAC.1
MTFTARPGYYHYSYRATAALPLLCQSTTGPALEYHYCSTTAKYCNTLNAGSSRGLLYEATTRARHLQCRNYNGTARLYNSTAFSLHHYH